ncbi:MAG: S41 family peptidase [Planctomycetota bacterium]|jgi:carboxyl-terminal processing protease
MAAAFLAVGPNHAEAGPKKPLHSQTKASVAGQTPQDALVINSACDKILRGDFESAQEIVSKSTVSDSKGLRELRKVIDEYMAIKTKRKALQHKGCQTQINKLKKLRQKGFSDDANNISKVFSIVLKTLEYADNKQRQALLRDSLIIRTVQKAKAKAVEFEAKGKWLDAYTMCYSKLVQIYQDDETYSDHAEQLLEKADIGASFQDSPCETYEERYAGIKKQMFINAVDVLDSGYVNIIDYQQMAIKAINRCQLLADVINDSGLDRKYNIKNSRLVSWSTDLAELLNKIIQLRSEVNKDRFIDIFEEVLRLNESHRVGIRLPEAFLVAQFAKGAWSALDPYTDIYWPNQTQDFEKAITNQFTGIGIRLSKEDELTKVVSVLPYTPAYNSGLEAGDIIYAVDGVKTNNMSSDCMVKRITGPEGTQVTLTINHADENKPSDITINRANIIIPSVQGWQRNKAGKWLYMIDGLNKIGYVRISSFNSKTADDFERALCQLKENGLKGLILDLRSNPGGLLSSAIGVVDKFIEEGLIVRTQPRFGIATYISANKENTYPNYPIVVLINSFTASASEIIAGVLRDPKHNRATLVGERTYGKGSVQKITDCPGGGTQLKYTAAYYHLPSGQRVESRDRIRKPDAENWGILPDVNVKLQSDELCQIAKVRKANEFIINVSHNNASCKVTRYSSKETINTDSQLAIGLLVLKSKMIRAGYELTEAEQQNACRGEHGRQCINLCLSKN